MGKQRKQSEMFPIVESFLQGQLSLHEFCHSQNIKAHTFQYWLTKYKNKDKGQSRIKKDQFVPLTIKESQTIETRSIKISYPSGMIIELPIH